MDNAVIAIAIAIASLVCSLMCSVVALYYTGSTAKRAKQEADMTMLNLLQSNYEAIRARMDMQYRINTWRPDPKDLSVWIPLEEYWFFCFREWWLTKGSASKRFSSLWDDYIVQAVKAGLSHAPLRFVLCSMRASGTFNDSYAEEFIEELIKLNGADLCDGFDNEIKSPLETNRRAESEETPEVLENIG